MSNYAIVELFKDKRQSAVLIASLVAAIAVGAAGMYVATQMSASASAPSGSVAQTQHSEEDIHDEEATVVSLAKEKWEAAGLSVKPVERGTLSGTSWVTGKITLNEDRLAHIYSLADGQVHNVHVQLGDSVKQGQVLAVVDSKEVGAAKLALYTDRLAAEFAKVNNLWAKRISDNTQELIKTLAAQPPLDSIDEKFADKPMGEYRQQLMTAYASLYKSRKDVERLQPLAKQGVAPGKQALAAKAAYEADRATFKGLLEQLKFTSQQQALSAEQKLRQAEQAVATSRSQLYILGYKETDLQAVDLLKEGEAIAHYEIRAPFDGTVIGKSVVLAERVGPDTEMFQVADLSSLWVQADIYQKDLPKLDTLGEKLSFRAPNSGHQHTANVFYTGDILDPETRTARLRAVVKNPQRHLKAGMFVEVALPGKSVSNALIVPTSALLQIDGNQVAFVQVGEEDFQKRNVTLGIRNGQTVHVLDGLKVGERLVVAGGFSLKSELLKGSISHGH